MSILFHDASIHSFPCHQNKIYQTKSCECDSNIYPLSISSLVIRCIKLGHVTDDTQIYNAPMWSLRLNRSICTLNGDAEKRNGETVKWNQFCVSKNDLFTRETAYKTNDTYVMRHETNSRGQMRSNTARGHTWNPDNVATIKWMRKISWLCQQ